MDKDGVGYVYDAVLVSFTKERNLAMCNNRDDLEGAMLSEESRRENSKCWRISFLWGIWKNKLTHKTQQKGSHRNQEKTGGCQWEGGRLWRREGVEEGYKVTDLRLQNEWVPGTHAVCRAGDTVTDYVKPLKWRQLTTRLTSIILKCVEVSPHCAVFQSVVGQETTQK